MKKLKKIDNSCAVVALHYVSGIAEDIVLRVCQLHEFHPKQGMDDKNWKAAGKDLGITVRAINFVPCTLKTFAREHMEGLYLLGTWDHLFVLDNGMIVDPRCARPPGLRRMIKQAWVVNKN